MTSPSPEHPGAASGPAAAGSARTRPPLWYTLGWYAVLPLVALYLSWRSLRQTDYRRHWGERFLGHARTVAAPGGEGTLTIWVHAVSVGETRAAGPLVDALARAHPHARFVLTHMTPTGRAAGAELVRAFPGRIAQRYLPYDLPFAVGRFLREVGPSVGVLMETEIWPQLLHAAHARAVPLVLANARLSARSLAKALRHPRLMRAAASTLTVVGAQSEADRARIAQIYDGPVHITGNGKFDQHPNAAQRAHGQRLRQHLQALLGARPLWLFASTREGEEKIILEALRVRAPSANPAHNPVLLFVPRHPQRFDAVAALLGATGAAVSRRAQWEAWGATPLPAYPPPVLLGDSMGEMALYYGMADVALIGGSLLPLGGQNLIEACACGCPVVLGPHMFNFAAAADAAIAAGAARQVADVNQALQCMEEITADPLVRSGMATAALEFAAAHRGATERTVAMIEQVLDGRKQSLRGASAAAH